MTCSRPHSLWGGTCSLLRLAGTRRHAEPPVFREKGVSAAVHPGKGEQRNETVQRTHLQLLPQRETLMDLSRTHVLENFWPALPTGQYNVLLLIQADNE